jgi:hypothetical protein
VAARAATTLAATALKQTASIPMAAFSGALAV